MSKRKNLASTSFGSSKWQKTDENSFPSSNDNQDDNSDEDEAPNKPIGEKLKAMINSPTLADLEVHFKGESRIFFAHKLILSIQSNIFAQMFRDTCPMSSTTRVIVINEFSPTIFKEILKFCYTDTADLNRGNVHGIMTCAKAYEIKELEDLCCKFCLKYLNISNVCEEFENCFMLDNELSRKCLNILCENIVHLIDNKSFFVLSKAPMINVLQSNALNVAEIDLFNAVHRGFENIAFDRQLDVLKCIRFGVMTTNESRGCYRKMVQMNFSTDEIDAIIKSSSGVKRVIFVNESIRLKYYSSDTFPRHTSFEFKVAKNVKIKSFYLDDHVSCDYTLKDIRDYIYYGLRFKANEKVIYECLRTTYFATPDKPIVLKPNTSYVLETWASNHLKKRDCKCSYNLYQFQEKNNYFIIKPQGHTYVFNIDCSVSQS